MGKMSINFENEEQYNNFIQSIKSEVMKEIENNPKQDRPDWVLFKEELKKDIDARREEENSDIRDSTVAGYSDYYPLIKEAFDVKRVDQFNTVNQTQLRNFKNDLFNLIDEYREENK